MYVCVYIYVCSVARRVQVPNNKVLGVTMIVLVVATNTSSTGHRSMYNYNMCVYIYIHVTVKMLGSSGVAM